MSITKTIDLSIKFDETVTEKEEKAYCLSDCRSRCLEKARK